MIRIQNISKRYQIGGNQEICALDNVEAHLPKRGLFCLLGKSGCGKSTLLHLIGGLDVPSDGTVCIANRSLSELTEKELDAYRNTCVGFVFQDSNLLEDVTVADNIALALRMQGEEARPELISEALEQVELSGYEERSVSELSGGQKQRVAIARALVKHSYMILADEPTGALDTQTTKEIFLLLKKLSKSRLVLVATHDKEAALTYGDGIVELQDGKVIWDTIRKPQKVEDNIVFRSAGLTFASRFRIAWETIQKQKKGFCAVVLLSVFAFLMLGILDTCQAFDYKTTLTDSVRNEKILPVRKSVGEGYLLTKDDIQHSNENTRGHFKGVYVPFLENMSIEGNYVHMTEDVKTALHYVSCISGFMELSKEDAGLYGCELIEGTYPLKEGEIAISKYLYESFCMTGYMEYEGPVYVTYGTDDGRWEFKQGASCEIQSPQDLLGCNLFIAGKNYTITGIVDTGFDKEYYQDLEGTEEEDADALQVIKWDRLRQEQKYGLHCLAFLADGMTDNLAASYPDVVGTEGMNVQLTYQDVTIPIRHIGRYSDYCKAQETAKIPWENYRDVTGEAGNRRKLSDDEFIFPVVYKEQEQSRDMQSWYSLSELYPQEGSNRLDAYGDFNVEITNAEGQMIHTNKTFKMVGCMNTSPVDYCGYRDTMLVSDTFFEMICKERAGRYTFAIGNVPQNKAALQNVIENLNENGYTYVGAISSELEKIEDSIGAVRGTFLGVSILLAIFAVFMFCHFMMTSITNKRREIGIMRSMGAGKTDIYHIFGAESALIGVIIFALVVVFTIILVYVGNLTLQRNIGIGINVLHFGLRQVILLLVLSLVSSVIAVGLPIRSMIKKKPIELVREL